MRYRFNSQRRLTAYRIRDILHRMNTTPNQSALARAILCAGSQLAFARSLRREDGTPVAQSTVSTWLLRDRQIAPEYGAQVERLYNVRCEELRNDLDWQRDESGAVIGWLLPVLPTTEQQAA